MGDDILRCVIWSSDDRFVAMFGDLSFCLIDLGTEMSEK